MSETEVRCPYCGNLYPQSDIESHIASTHN
jgi:hypothetical protein